VINIDWSESDITADGKELFKDEGVTVGLHYVHAWGYQKAQQYIKMLLAS